MPRSDRPRRSDRLPGGRHRGAFTGRTTYDGRTGGPESTAVTAAGLLERPNYLGENTAPAELQQLRAAHPVAGARYGESAARLVNR